jgi:hypothetical protein
MQGLLQNAGIYPLQIIMKYQQWRREKNHNQRTTTEPSLPARLKYMGVYKNYRAATIKLNHEIPQAFFFFFFFKD